MANDFSFGIGVVAQADAKKIQSQVDSQTKNVKLKLNVDATEIQKQINTVAKTQKNAFSGFDKNSYVDVWKKLGTQMDSVAQKTQIVSDRAKAASSNFNAYAQALKPSTIREYSSQLSSVSQAFADAAKSGKQIDYSKATSQMNLLKSSIKEAGKDTQSFTQILGNDIQKFAQWTASATILMQALNAVKSSINTVYQTDQSLTDLRMVTGGTVEETQALIDTYNQLGQILGATTQQVTDSANEWLRQGKTVEETNTLITNSMVLSKIAQLSSSDATQYLTSAMLGYKVAVGDTIDIVDKLSAVDMESATSAGGLAEAMSRTSASADLAGVSMDKLIAYIATVGEVTQKEMSSIGESFKTIFSRMGNVKLGQLTDEDGNDISSELSDVEKILNHVDIKLRDSADTFRDFDDVLDDVGKNWGSFTEVEQSAIATTFAGVRQRENFIVLMENYSKSLKYTETAANSAGTAMEKFGYYQESASAKAAKTQAAIESLAMDTLDSDFIKGFFDASTAIVQFVEKTDLLKIALVALASYGIAKSSIAVAGLVKSVQGYLVTLGALIAEEIAVTGSTNALTAGMAALNVAMELNPVGAIVAALTALVGATFGAVAIYDKFNVSLEEAQANASKLKEEYDSLQSELSNTNSELETTAKRIDELNSKDSLTIIEQDELKNLKETNEQLQTQIELLQRQSDLKNKDLNSAIKTEYDKRYGSESNVQKTIAEAGTPWYDQSQFLGTEQDYVKYEIERLKELNSIKEKGVSLTKDEQKEYEKISEYLTNVGVDYADFASRYTIDDNTKQSWIDMADLINKTLNPESYNQKSFTDIYDSESFKSAKTKLEEMAKAGTLSTETLNSNKEFKQLLDQTSYSAEQVVEHIKAIATASNELNNSDSKKASGAFNIFSNEDATKSIDEFQSSISTVKQALQDLKSGDLTQSEVVDLMQEFGIGADKVDLASKSFNGLKQSLENVADSRLNVILGNLKGYLNTGSIDQGQYDDLVKAFTEMAKTASDATKSVGSLKDVVEGFESISTNMSTIDNAFAELKSKSALSLDSITALQAAFGKTEGFDKFLATVTSAKSITGDVQDAFDSLVGTYISTSGVLDDLNDSNKDLIINQLELMGVTNASEIVTNRLALQKQFLAEMGHSVADATAEEIIAFVNETNASADAENALIKLAASKWNVNNVAVSTSGDIKNLLGLMATANATAKSLQILEAYKSGAVKAGGTSAADMSSIMAQAQAEADAYYDSLGSNTNYNYGGGSKSAGVKGKKGSSKDTKQTIDWIQRLRDLLDSAKEKSKQYFTQIASTFKYQNKEIDKSIKLTEKQISLEEKSYKSYMKKAKAVGLSASLQKKVQNGAMDITEYSGKTADKIKEYQEWYDKAQEVKNSIRELKLEEKELAKQKITNIIDDYDKKSAMYDSLISQRQSKISLTETKGGTAKASDYTYLIEQSGKQKASIQAEYNKVSSEFNKLVKKGTVKKGSDDWYEYTNTLNELKAKINDVANATEQYKNQLQQLKWDKFDDSISGIDENMSEIDQLIKLTKEGSNEEVLLLTEGFDQAKKKSADLKAEIAKLNAQYANDKGNTIYLERLKELRSELYSAVDAMQSYNDALIQSIKIRYDDQIDSLEKERDAYEDLINAQKKALRQEKENHDYQKSISEKNESISDVQARIKELEKAAKTGDRNAMKEKADLEEELADLKDDLAETQYDREIELQEDALDNALDAYNKEIDAKKLAIQSLYDKEAELIKQAATLSESQFKAALDNIKAYAEQNNLTISDSLSSAFNGNDVQASSNNSQIQSILENGKGTGKGTSDLNSYVKKEYGGQLSYVQMAEIAKLLGFNGVTSESIVNDTTMKKKILEELRAKGFSSGGTIGKSTSSGALSDLIKMSGENVLIPAKTGEGILTGEQNRAWLELVPQLTNLSRMIPNITTPNLSNITTNNNSSPTVHITIPITGNADSKTVAQLNATANNIAKQTAKEVLNIVRVSKK